MVDLNPKELSGINLKDLIFCHLLIVWIAGTPRKAFRMQDQVQAVQNFKNAAHYDLKTVKIVTPNGEAQSVADAGLDIIKQMKDFYCDFPEEIREVLEFEEEKLLDPEKRYSWIIRKEFEENYTEKGLLLAESLQKEINSYV